MEFNFWISDWKSSLKLNCFESVIDSVVIRRIFSLDICNFVHTLSKYKSLIHGYLFKCFKTLMNSFLDYNSDCKSCNDVYIMCLKCLEGKCGLTIYIYIYIYTNLLKQAGYDTSLIDLNLEFSFS